MRLREASSEFRPSSWLNIVRMYTVWGIYPYVMASPLGPSLAGGQQELQGCQRVYQGLQGARRLLFPVRRSRCWVLILVHARQNDWFRQTGGDVLVLCSRLAFSRTLLGAAWNFRVLRCCRRLSHI